MNKCVDKNLFERFVCEALCEKVCLLGNIILLCSNTLTHTAKIHIYSSHCISVNSVAEQKLLWFEMCIY